MADDRLSVSSGDDNDASPLFIVSEDDTNINNDRNSTSKSCTKQHYCISIVMLLFVCVTLSAVLINVIVRYHNKLKNSYKISNHGTSDDFLFFQISDTHLDIYYNSNVTFPGQLCRNIPKRDGSNYNISQTTAPYGRAGCDTPDKLLQAAAQHMEQINKENGNKAQFVLLSGDQVAHRYDKFNITKSDLILWSIGNSTRSIAESLRIPVIPAIGNNDLPKDYEPPVTYISQFYGNLSEKVSPYIFPDGSITRKLNSIQKFNTDFCRGGYYSLNVTDDVVVIVVNSNYWNSGAIRLNSKVEEIGQNQMSWFSNELNIFNKSAKKVIILGHIPPGISSYGNEGSFWLDEFTQRYVTLVTKYQNIIGQFYGHVHQDKLKIHQKDDVFPAKAASPSNSYILICPSVTPIYGSNPAFRLFTLNKESKEILDYAQYYMDLLISNINQSPIWNLEYKFTELYDSEMNLEAVIKIVDEMVTPLNSTWLPYSQHMKTLFSGISSSHRFIEYCAARYTNDKSFQACKDYFKTRGG